MNTTTIFRATAFMCAVCTIGASTAHASDLVKSAEADSKFKIIEKSIFLYDDKPYSIEAAIEKNEVAGMSIVLIHDGKPAIHRTYGYRIKKREEKATNQTIYQCASMSKMVSSFGFVTAARRGDVQLDQPVTELNQTHRDTLLTRWEEKYFKNETSMWSKDITLRRLLSHTAGLDVHGISAAPWLPSKEPLENILFGKSLFKDAVKPLHRPGTKYLYSGGGYTVAEAWLEIATGKKFKDYLKQHVLEPLGMTQSTYETGDEDTSNLAWGCSRGVCLYNVRTLDVKAAGGLLCHPADYARLVALIMNKGKEYLPEQAGAQRIPSEDVIAMLTPSKHKDTGDPIPSSGEWYGLGVSLNDEDMEPDGLTSRFSHGGAQQGFSNEFYAHRGLNSGIVVLVNGDREWTKNKEVYGGNTLQEAVVQAFKVAYGIVSEGKPLTPRCTADTQCSSGQFCNAGVDVTKNQCMPKKTDNDTCDIAGGDHQCKSGYCKLSRCYTPNSVPMGGACYLNDACKEGKCSSLDGTKGTCVCQADADCGAGKYCNAGFDATKNSCIALKSDNETCDLAGGGHQCKSGFCKFSRCYTPNSVGMNGTCYNDGACKEA
ncbi:MAG: serine hydrolase domain-containing protein [Nitrospira sp.]